MAGTRLFWIVTVLLSLVGVVIVAARLTFPDDLVLRLQPARSQILEALDRRDSAAMSRLPDLERFERNFAEHHALTRWHIIPGGLFIVLAPLQLAGPMRRRFPGLHRWTGRFLLFIGAIAAATGLYFGVVLPIGGLGESIIITVTSTVFVSAIVCAFRAIRRGNVISHREWMLRAFGVMVAVPATRVMGVTLDVVFAPAGINSILLLVIDLWLTWAIVIGTTEWWIRSNRKGALLALIVLIGFGATASAQDASDAKINAYIRAEMARRQIPGLALVVLKDHQVIFSGNYGLADVTSKTPVTGRTSFEIASMTKQFTDAAILLLAEQGKLALTDPISRYFADLPGTWRAITIQQLMNHTAGLRDDWDEDDAFFTSRTTSAEFFDALKASPLKFSPGTGWSYSCGPFVLGLIIERVTGKSYAQFMRESIFDRLGMTSTAVNDGAANAPDRAAGYVIRDRAVQPGVRISPAAHARGDVGIRTTTADLSRWDAALDDPSFLPAAGRALMFSPARLNNGEVLAYGLGWFVTPFRGHTEIAHGGSFRTGFDSAIVRYPDDRLTIVILTNRFHAGSMSMARAIASFYNDDYRPIAMMQPRPDRAGPRTNVVARIMASLRSGEKPNELLPDLGRLAGWSREELRSELAKASSPAVIDCQNLVGKGVTAFEIPIVANCFYRTAGDKLRYWTVSFTADDRVAYMELEQ